MNFRQSSWRDISYRASLLTALILLLAMSRDAPISGDEYVHVKQAKKNIRYFMSGGSDREALDTPISRLKHYGQAFDTFTVFVSQKLGIRDLYRFRHMTNAFIAWLIVLFTSLVVIKITGSKTAGIIAVLLLIITGRFTGHAMNNLKDIPFALSFIFSFYFMLRFYEKMPEISWKDALFIALGIASGISIRIGGLLIFAYFMLFTGLYVYYLFVSDRLSKGHRLPLQWKTGVISLLIFIVAYGLGILPWPWAWEDPIGNPLESLALMHHYPTTVRQVFEGKLYWSDRFPWYYLLKYLLITLPVLLLMGIGAFFVLARRLDVRQVTFSVFMLIAAGFPLYYTAASGANVYGGWRQVLFILPPLVVLAATGLWLVGERMRKNHYFFIGITLFSLYPFYFTAKYYPYQYTFFNVFTGGTGGAYGHYELDYYFTSFKKGYEVIDTLTAENPLKVAANFIIPEYYEDKPYQPVFIDYYNRSAVAWDYAVICNTFLDPWQLRNGRWPPDNTVYTVNVQGRPVMAIIERRTEKDLEGIELMKNGRFFMAIKSLRDALGADPGNESIMLNLARAYFKTGDMKNALFFIEKLEEVYPDSEWATDLRGEIAMKSGDMDQAIRYFEKNIEYNYKFFHSYINLAKAKVQTGEREKAKKILKECLRINPFYEPAYKLYGKLLIEEGKMEEGQRMLDFRVNGDSKYGIKQ